MIYVYNIAGLNISLNVPYEIELMYRFKEFYIGNNEEKSDICYNFIESENRKQFKTNPIHSGVEFDVFFEDNIFYRQFKYLNSKKPNSCLVDKGDSNYTCYLYDKYTNETIQYSNVFDSLAIESTFIKHDVFILHSSFINYKGRAILFSGNSGVGKSTQANLWEMYKNADQINGDRAFIRKKNDTWYAYGSPFAGSSKIYKNECYPIKAIVMLVQAKVNKITRLTKSQALKSVIKQVTINTWNGDFYNRVIDLVDNLTDDIPIYLLECLPNEEAVDLLDEYIKENI